MQRHPTVESLDQLLLTYFVSGPENVPEAVNELDGASCSLLEQKKAQQHCSQRATVVPTRLPKK